jgi:hypothetical protein
MELLEGFHDLDDEQQAMVKHAIEEGHVADEDWRGDPQQNRPGKRGKFTRTPVKRQAKEESVGGDTPDPTPKKSKTRKKAIKKEAPADDADPQVDAETPRKPARTRKKRVKVEEDVVKVEEVDPAFEPTEQPARERTRRAAAKTQTTALDTHEDNTVAPEAADDPTNAPKPKKRGRPRKERNTVEDKDATERATGPIQEPSHVDEEPGDADEEAPRRTSKRAAALAQPTAASSRSRRAKSAE